MSNSAWLWVGYGLLYIASAGVGIVCGGVIGRVGYGIYEWFRGKLKARRN